MWPGPGRVLTVGTGSPASGARTACAPNGPGPTALGPWVWQTPHCPARQSHAAGYRKPGEPGQRAQHYSPQAPVTPQNPRSRRIAEALGSGCRGEAARGAGEAIRDARGAAGFAGLRRAEARGVHVSSSEAGGPQRAQSQAGADPRGPRGGQLVVPSAVCRTPVRPRSIRPVPAASAWSQQGGRSTSSADGGDNGAARRRLLSAPGFASPRDGSL